jgi:hypothetical protein
MLALACDHRTSVRLQTDLMTSNSRINWLLWPKITQKPRYDNIRQICFKHAHTTYTHTHITNASGSSYTRTRVPSQARLDHTYLTFHWSGDVQTTLVVFDTE